MCVIYLAGHTGCEHKHFLGFFNCGNDCPSDTRHSFYVEHSGSEDDCTVCVLENGKQLDPEVVPVEYYPPGEHFGVKLNKGYGMCSVERIVEEPERMVEKTYEHHHRQRAGSLSDVDSDTSEWRQGRTTPVNGNEDVQEFETPHTNATPLTNQATPRTNETTPKTRAHRNMVHNQLNQLPTRLAKRTLDPFAAYDAAYNRHMAAWPLHLRTMWPPAVGVSGQAPRAPRPAPFPVAYPQPRG
jgi:hypothetical protein